MRYTRVSRGPLRWPSLTIMTPLASRSMASWRFCCSRSAEAWEGGLSHVKNMVQMGKVWLTHLSERKSVDMKHMKFKYEKKDTHLQIQGVPHHRNPALLTPHPPRLLFILLGQPSSGN